MIEEIWRTYHQGLHRFIQIRVGDAAVADDILQDVFIKIHSGIDGLKDSAKIKSWVYQITRNAIIDYYRSQKNHTQLPDDLSGPEIDHSEQAQQELGACLIPMIKALPDHYRDALMLSEIDEIPQKQVAEKLGISLSGAKSRVQRGRVMVKEMLSDCCSIERDHRGSLVDYEPRSSDCKGC